MNYLVPDHLRAARRAPQPLQLRLPFPEFAGAPAFGFPSRTEPIPVQLPLPFDPRDDEGDESLLLAA